MILYAGSELIKQISMSNLLAVNVHLFADFLSKCYGIVTEIQECKHIFNEISPHFSSNSAS